MRAPPWATGSLAALAIAVLSPGCADGGDDDSAAETPRESFIARVDTFCQRTSALVHDGIQPYLDQGLEAVETAAVSGGMVEEIVAPDLEALAVAIAALRWPPGDTAKLKAFLAELQEVAEEGRENPRGLVLQHLRALSEARRAADAYGLSECGRLRVVLPGEGDEDEDGSEFAEGADALCRRAVAIVQAELQPHVGRGSRAVRRPAAIEKMATAIALELEAMNGAVEVLSWAEADDEEKQRLQAFFDALEELFEADIEEPKRLVFDSRQLLAPARRAAEDAGLSYCGRFWIVLPNARSDARLL